MSIDYFVIKVRDVSQLGALIEGGETDVPPIDVGEVYRRLTTQTMVQGPERSTLRWEGEGSYVFVDITPGSVQVNHGTGGGDMQLEVIMEVLYALQQMGLYVWDPQQGSWYPGS